MSEIAKEFEELQRTIQEFKKSNDDRLTALEKNRGTAELQEKLEKMDNGIDGALKRLEKLETAANRTVPVLETDDTKKKARNEALRKFLRDGNDVELKALSVGSNPDGGYLVLPELSNLIQAKAFETSPMRKLARLVTISSSQWEEMAQTDEAAASWVGEQSTRSTTSTPTLGKLTVSVHELQAMPAATQSVLDDASIDLEAWLAQEVANKFDRKEATAFIAGSGVGQPMGITSYASGTSYGQLERVNSGTSGSVTADGLISLQDALFEDFQANASFLMARATRTAVRKLKDNQNQYLWSIDRGLNEGVQESLLGKPLYLAADMPAIGAGALSIAYGDFKRGYVIVDRIGIRMLRDPYSSKPNVLFYTTKRVGGAVCNYQAIKLQALS